MSVDILHRKPTPTEFSALRAQTEWGVPDIETAKSALEHSLMGCVALTPQGGVIGMVRVVGDGVLNIYIQDVVVDRDYRGQGVGQALLRALIFKMQAMYPSDCFVSLLAAQGQSLFYERLGFAARPTQDFGPGMSAALCDLGTGKPRVNCVSPDTNKASAS